MTELSGPKPSDVAQNRAALPPTPAPADVVPGSTPARPVAPRAVALAYEHGSRRVREWVVTGLMRPLGPLALAAVASGAFAVHLTRPAATATSRFGGDLAAHSPAQVYELARFTEQVSPQAVAELLAGLARGAPAPAGRATATQAGVARAAGAAAPPETPSVMALPDL